MTWAASAAASIGLGAQRLQAAAATALAARRQRRHTRGLRTADCTTDSATLESGHQPRDHRDALHARDGLELLQLLRDEALVALVVFGTAVLHDQRRVLGQQEVLEMAPLTPVPGLQSRDDVLRLLPVQA